MFSYNTREFITYIHNVLTLLATDSAVSHLELRGIFLAHVSSIITRSLLLLSTLGGPGPVSTCVTPPPAPTPPKLVPGIPGSGQHPGSLSGIVMSKIVLNRRPSTEK